MDYSLLFAVRKRHCVKKNCRVDYEKMRMSEANFGENDDRKRS